MEDRVLVEQGLPSRSLGSDAAALFGVFDGHAGDATARFAEAGMAPAVLRHLDGGGGGGPVTGPCPGGLREALARAFLAVDAGFCTDREFAPELRSGAGCTALVVAFDGRDKLVAANLVRSRGRSRGGKGREREGE